MVTTICDFTWAAQCAMSQGQHMHLPTVNTYILEIYLKVTNNLRNLFAAKSYFQISVVYINGHDSPLEQKQNKESGIF